MPQHIQAVYENGVFRPLSAVSLREADVVSLTIGDPISRTAADEEFLAYVRAEVAALEHRPTLQEVHQALASVPGSMADEICAQREERF